MSKTASNNTVQAAIDDSIRESRVVHLTISGVGGQYDAVMADLERVAEDWVAAGELEYWGTDGDGDQWRVHMERRLARVAWEVAS